MLAYTYPLLGAFWTMFWFFIWIIWLFVLFRVILDIFRSHDLGGWGKAGWLIFTILLPYLGVFVYLIARGKGMGERDVKDAEAQDQAFRSYVQEAAGSKGTSTADELAKLADLRDRGVITSADFEQQKAKILA
jgi:hypothetical protein